MKSFPRLSFFEGKKTLFLTHAGADVDSLASCASIYFSLKKNSNCKIGVLDHISSSAKIFAKKIGIEFEINPSFEGFDVLFFCDFSGFEMLGSQAQKVKDFSGQIYLIDHHSKTDSLLLQRAFFLVDEKSVSCTQVVYNYLKKSKANVSKKVATMIACGVLTDSGRFSVVSENVFLLMHELLSKFKLDYYELFSFFDEEIDFSEKVARLKSAKRVRLFKSFDKLLVFSEVNAFEPSSASSLVFLGATIAFCGGEKEGKIVISARASNYFVSKTGFHLVDHVFVPLSKKFSGKGGGHAAAAGFNGENFDLKKALDECVRLSHVFLEKKNNSNSTLKELV